MMNKVELIKSVAEKSGLKRNQADAAVSAFVDTVTETLKTGEPVKITGFGAFECRTRAARTGVNPRTQEPCEIKEMVVPAFRAGSSLKEAVRG